MVFDDRKSTVCLEEKRLLTHPANHYDLLDDLSGGI